MNTQTQTQCWCGHDLTEYAYSVENGRYDAWPVPAHTAPVEVLAASRSDVLDWQTSFRTPAHDVLAPDGDIVCYGGCRELHG